MKPKKSWKTTTLGVLLIAGTLINAGVSFLKGIPINYEVTYASIMAGAAAIAAKDSGVSGTGT